MTNPASLLLALAEQDHRMWFAYQLSNNQFIYANPAFESFFQVIASNTSINMFCGIIHPDDKDYLKQISTTLQPGVLKNNIEFRLKLADQEYFLRLSLLLQTQENEENIITGYMENITDYKAYSNQLNEMTSKKKDVLNIISHDLAAPLGSIQNLAALTSRKTKVTEDQEAKKFISLIEEISKKSIHKIHCFVKKEFVELAVGNLGNK